LVLFLYISGDRPARVDLKDSPQDLQGVKR
jgi:hypothetical protein